MAGHVATDIEGDFFGRRQTEMGKETRHGLEAVKRDIELEGDLFQALPLEVAEFMLNPLYAGTIRAL